MDNLFLPRGLDSIETGSQIFAGTNNVLNTSIFFIQNPLPPELPGLLNSVLIQNGGYSVLNGVFNYTLEFDEKPYYNKDGNSNYFTAYFENKWQIYDFSENSLEGIYYSTENVLYPWLVTNWLTINSIYLPVPIVTKIL
jgi:hypothetical protein